MKNVWIEGDRIRLLQHYVEVDATHPIMLEEIKISMAEGMAREIVDKLWEFDKITAGSRAGKVCFHARIEIIVPKMKEEADG